MNSYAPQKITLLCPTLMEQTPSQHMTSYYQLPTHYHVSMPKPNQNMVRDSSPKSTIGDTKTKAHYYYNFEINVRASKLKHTITKTTLLKTPPSPKE